MIYPVESFGCYIPPMFRIRSGLLLAALFAACGDDPAAGPPGPGPTADSGIILCTESTTCPGDLVCVGGVCATAVHDGGADGGVASGRVVVDPLEVNFGAFLLGVPVTRTLTVINRGDGPLRVLQLEVERNTSNEFVVIPGETLPTTLASGASLTVQITYTATDGQDDRDRLRVITDDPATPTTIVPLIAEYKGLSEIAVIADAKTSGPEIRTIDFGEVPLTSTRTFTLFVKNIGDGNAVLSISDVRTDPSPSLIFDLTTSAMLPALLNRFRSSALCTPAGTCDDMGAVCTDGLCIDPRSGAPIDTISITVGFAPRVEGPVEETLVIANNEGDADETPVLIRLLGIGVRAALDVSPSPIDVGVVFIGFPKVVPISLTSIGGDSIDITGIALNGASAGLMLDLPTMPPFMLGPGAMFAFSLISDPAAAGPISGTVQIDSSDPDLPRRTVTITGESRVAPRVVTSTPAIAFGEVHVFRIAGQSESLVVRVTNAGGSSLDITSIGLGPGTSSDFVVTPTQVVQPIAPGDGVDLTVRYGPTVIGPDTGSLVITTNDPLTPRLEIPLSGEGVDPNVFAFKSTVPPIPPSPIDFGRPYRGSTPPPVILTIQNTGVGRLLIQSAALTAGSSTEYTINVLSPLPALVAPGSPGLTIEVRYAPTAVGADNGAIEIRTSDRDTPTLIVALIGDAVGCPTNTWDIDNNPLNGCEYTCTQRNPPAEICNNADDDCNGTTDEGFNLGDVCDGAGECGAGVIECAARDSSRSTCSTNPGQSGSGAVAETCNTLDDDCDGTPDDGFNLQGDLANCGRCGNACSAANGTAVCSSGTCAVQGCNPNFDNCNGTYADGCEVDLRSNLANCGLCNRPCEVTNGTPSCSNGTCNVAACNNDFFDCNNRVIDGCEANLANSVSTCGSCLTQCSVPNGTPACNARSCEVASCVAPWRNCDNQYAGGCEANTDSSIAHCGGCNQPCVTPNGTPSCNSGACAVAACSAPFADCNTTVADGCEVNTQTSIPNCGGCNQPCAIANGTPLCSGGTCAVSGCNLPFANCNNNPADGCEANLSNSVGTCGSCFNACSVANGTPGCSGSACTVAACNAPFRDCNLVVGDGCETNSNSSLTHCGGCNQACTVANGNPVCNNGACNVASCTAPFLDCNTTPGDGCEINSNTNSLHCGGCNQACALTNAVSSCNGSGSCRVDACNGAFRDCNLLPVDGCEIDSNSSLAHCGGCNRACNFAGATETCNTGVCTFGACSAGFVNLDGNNVNGCEYACTPVGGLDLPDLTFVDSNCDGIDGDRSTSIFVSPLGNNANTGFYGSPVATIAQGILRAQQNGFSTVLIAAGFYAGVVDVAAGISLYGGYDANTWARAGTNNSVISGGIIGANVFGVRALNIVVSTRLDLLVVTVGNAVSAGGSVYGVHVAGSNSALVLSRLRVTSGRGADGSDGSGGGAGGNANNGNVGSTGCDGCSSAGGGGGGGFSPCGRSGGGGGLGGYDNNPGGGGTTPFGGGTGGGGGGGARGCSTCSGCNGQTTGSIGLAGTDGASGGNGPNGAAGSGAGSVASNLWQPGNGGTGSGGGDGFGGGGGGGGGGGADECYANVFVCVSVNTCNRDRGGGGGGGGGGGCGGGGGNAGTGGGASFGIFLAGSSPTLDSNTITPGRGGDGGDGGGGGSLGSGGLFAGGGFGPDDSGDGQRGGNGGNGGSGGAGGGGAGGVGYGIYRASGSNPTLISNSVTAGSGGFGGFSPGNNGGAGQSGVIF